MNCVSFDAGLIRKYGGRGPRYTSYPTAVQFREGFGPDQYREHVQQSNLMASPTPLSLYLHLPFCRTLCYYCACTKFITRNEERAQRYLDCLHAETRMHAALLDPRRRVEQIHLGGGTPTFYDDAQLAGLMQCIGACFSLAPADELQCSIEVDPRTVSVDRIHRLAAMGFNRLSLGVQDFDPQVQRAVNRVQSCAETLALIDEARRASFRSVSIDLIYGLPLQATGRFSKTLETVVSARPDRIALYSYAHLPGMFRPQKLIHVDDLPSDEEKLDLLKLSIERLTAGGYEYIGMDHFALASDELVGAHGRGELHRNFQGYSTHARCDLLGIGASSIGNVANSFSQNAKNTNAYCKLVEGGKLPIVRGIRLDADDVLRAQIIQSLMCYGCVEIESVEAAHDLSFTDYFREELPMLRELEDDGLVELDERQIRVTSAGQLLLRPIAMVFDRYLRHAATEAFSKVI